MKQISIVLPEPTYEAIKKRAESERMDIALYCSALFTELAGQNSPQPILEEKPLLKNGEKIKEIELVQGIVGYLKQHGGRAQKPIVEKALFEKFKAVFQDPYYLEPIGGGVPRWKKNVQFASNTAKNMGLMKPHNESGRGIWELTEKGRQWNFQ